MASLTISDRPSKFIWADDEEDNWDFDTWKAMADDSAPTLDSLPPLQLPAERDDPPYIVYGAKAITEAAPWVTSEDTSEIQHPVPAAYQQSGSAVVAWRYTRDRDDARPAYFELSAYEDGTDSPFKRINYAANWKRIKSRYVWDASDVAFLRKSNMRDVETIEVEVEEPLEYLTTQDTHDAQTPIAETRELEKEHTTSAIVSSSEEDAPKPVCTNDEGYYSDATPPTSPTLSAFKGKISVPCCATQLGLSPATSFIMLRRRESQDALRKNVEVDTVNDGPLDAIGLASSLPFNYDEDAASATREKPGVAEVLSIVTATGWSHVSSVHWTTAAVVATGLLAGAGLYLARRR
jgi:hypothetical protein